MAGFTLSGERDERYSETGDVVVRLDMMEAFIILNSGSTQALDRTAKLPSGQSRLTRQSQKIGEHRMQN